MGRSVICPYSFCDISSPTNQGKEKYYQTIISEVSDNNATMRYWHLINEEIPELSKKSKGFWNDILVNFLNNFEFNRK
ncbi:hypothetical protein [Desulfolucanica intricata]|uniref:hypothetical protein n=1 Tax=Desulfolucanica intricata TaxID=1285191 RepID=UPI0008378654|nr:hypothetical protein [Desulfolucanica intricata]